MKPSKTIKAVGDLRTFRGLVQEWTGKDWRIVRTEKPCSKCRIVKKLEEFEPHPLKRDGRGSWCKSCNKVRFGKRYRTAKRKEYNSLIKLIRAGEYKARDEMKYAIKKGTLVRESCFFCGNKKTEGHHMLYKFPLSVVWLCHIHHCQVHKEARVKKYFSNKPLTTFPKKKR